MAERARRISRPNARSVRGNRDSSGFGIAESCVEPTIVVLVGPLRVGDSGRGGCCQARVFGCHGGDRMGEVARCFGRGLTPPHIAGPDRGDADSCRRPVAFCGGVRRRGDELLRRAGELDGTLHRRAHLATGSVVRIGPNSWPWADNCSMSTAVWIVVAVLAVGDYCQGVVADSAWLQKPAPPDGRTEQGTRDRAGCRIGEGGRNSLYGSGNRNTDS